MRVIDPPIIDGRTDYHADMTAKRTPVPSGFSKREQSKAAMFYANGTVTRIHKGTLIRNSHIFEKEIYTLEITPINNGIHIYGDTPISKPRPSVQ